LTEGQWHSLERSVYFALDEHTLPAYLQGWRDRGEADATLIECGKMEPVDEEDAKRYAKHNETIQRWADGIRSRPEPEEVE
jgi:hypothetical protein